MPMALPAVNPNGIPHFNFSGLIGIGAMLLPLFLYQQQSLKKLLDCASVTSEARFPILSVYSGSRFS